MQGMEKGDVANEQRWRGGSEAETVQLVREQYEINRQPGAAS
jgi:hypothetical protein